MTSHAIPMEQMGRESGGGLLMADVPRRRPPNSGAVCPHVVGRAASRFGLKEKRDPNKIRARDRPGG